jgi:hypothetical protein
MAERKGGFPTLRRALLAAALAATVVLMVPHLALADGTTVQLGQAAGGGVCTNVGGADTVQVSTTGIQYSLPARGSIMSWTVLDAQPDTFLTDPVVRLELWHPAGPNTYTLVGVTDEQTIPQDGSLHAAFDIRANPLQGDAGDLLGLWEGPVATCGQFTFGTWTNQYAVTWDTNPVAGQTTTFGAPRQGWLLDVEADFVAGPSSPTIIDDCLDGGWTKLADTAGTPFKNQGDCVSFVATGGKNTAAG